GHRALGAALVDAAKERRLKFSELRDFDAPIGRGVTGKVDGHQLVIGNLRIMKESGVDAAVLAGEAQKLRQEGATAIFIAIDGKAAGLVAIADPIKSTTPGAVAALQ